MRPGIKIGLAVCMVMLLLCSAGGLAVAAQAGRDLIVPGAEDVQIERSKLTRLAISYRLPPDQTRYDVRRYLSQQGWNRMRAQTGDRATTTLTRVWFNGLVRDVVTVQPHPTELHRVVIRTARCFRYGSWMRCP